MFNLRNISTISFDISVFDLTAPDNSSRGSETSMQLLLPSTSLSLKWAAKNPLNVSLNKWSIRSSFDPENLNPTLSKAFLFKLTLPESGQMNSAYTVCMMRGGPLKEEAAGPKGAEGGIRLSEENLFHGSAPDTLGLRETIKKKRGFLLPLFEVAEICKLYRANSGEKPEEEMLENLLGHIKMIPKELLVKGEGSPKKRLSDAKLPKEIAKYFVESEDEIGIFYESLIPREKLLESEIMKWNLILGDLEENVGFILKHLGEGQELTKYPTKAVDAIKEAEKTIGTKESIARSLKSQFDEELESLKKRRKKLKEIFSLFSQKLEGLKGFFEKTRGSLKIKGAESKKEPEDDIIADKRAKELSDLKAQQLKDDELHKELYAKMLAAKNAYILGKENKLSEAEINKLAKNWDIAEINLKEFVYKKKLIKKEQVVKPKTDFEIKLDEIIKKYEEIAAKLDNELSLDFEKRIEFSVNLTEALKDLKKEIVRKLNLLMLDTELDTMENKELRDYGKECLVNFKSKLDDKTRIVPCEQLSSKGILKKLDPQVVQQNLIISIDELEALDRVFEKLNPIVAQYNLLASAQKSIHELFLECKTLAKVKSIQET